MSTHWERVEACDDQGVPIKKKYITFIHECRTLCRMFMYDYEVRALRVSLKCDFASVLEDGGASVFSVLIFAAVVLVVVHL